MGKKLYFLWEFIKYVFWGVLAAGVNTGGYALFTRIFHFGIVTSTVFAWLAANIFAFFCNLFFVFSGNENKTLSTINSKEPVPHKKSNAVPGNNKKWQSILSGLLFFLFTRLAGGAGDTGVMYIFCELLYYPDLPVKIISAGFWGILNYLLGKFLIFKNHF